LPGFLAGRRRWEIVDSCFPAYKSIDNVRRGERSQEITFDFFSAEAGIWRRAQAIRGHRYQIKAWGKRAQRVAGGALAWRGLDRGEDWQAASLTWHRWDETEEDVWVHTQVTVRASGETTLTVFLKGYYPFDAQGARRCLMICAQSICDVSCPVSNHVLSFHLFPAIIMA
jgi:hypothetical protein